MPRRPFHRVFSVCVAVPVYAGSTRMAGGGTKGGCVAGGNGRGAGGGLRVFVSHTSELREFPRGGSYVAAVERAVSACGHVIVDMADFPAGDMPPAELCAERVRSCDVYVGVLGTRYGSPVPDRPGLSYTELEFEAATETGLERLMFLLDTEAEDAGIPLSRLIDLEFGARQEAFRRRVRAADWSRSRSVTRLCWDSWSNGRCGNWPATGRRGSGGRSSRRRDPARGGGQGSRGCFHGGGPGRVSPAGNGWRPRWTGSWPRTRAGMCSLRLRRAWARRLSLRGWSRHADTCRIFPGTQGAGPCRRRWRTCRRS